MAHITTIQKLEREKYKELKVLVNEYETVNVGSSSANEKRVDLYMSDAKVVPRIQAEGTYSLVIDGTMLVVTRTDKPTGWEENLQVTVYENGSEIDAKIAEIEELSQMRRALYKQLSQMNTSNHKIDNMEEELNYAREQLQTRYAATNDNMRQAQINTYYDKQYQSYADVLKYAILFTVIFILIGMIYRLGFLSERVLQPIIWIFLAVTIIVFGSKLRDISRRDNMDYDSYQTPGNVASQMSKGKVTTKTTNVSSECRGAECCADGQRYDYIRHVCAEIIDI